MQKQSPFVTASPPNEEAIVTFTWNSSISADKRCGIFMKIADKYQDLITAAILPGQALAEN